MSPEFGSNLNLIYRSRTSGKLTNEGASRAIKFLDFVVVNQIKITVWTERKIRNDRTISPPRIKFPRYVPSGYVYLKTASFDGPLET